MKNQQRIIYILLGIVLLLLLSRFLFAFRFAFVGLLIIGGLGYLFYRLYGWWSGRAQRRAFANSTSGRIAKQVSYCETMATANHKEMEELQREIDELQRATDNADVLNTSNRQESAKLLNAFKRELQLRHTKKQFFESCIDKLHRIRYNNELSYELEEKKRRLQSYQEDKYESLAELEELRYQLEHETYYLDAIDELSQKMLTTTSAEKADGVQLELEKMTESIKRLDRH